MVKLRIRWLVLCCLSSAALLLTSAPLAAQTRLHVAVLPVHNLYRAQPEDWLPRMLQEELSRQLQLNDQFAVMAPETARLWEEHLPDQISPLMREARLSHVLQLATQQVLQRLSIRWTLFYIQDNQLQQLDFRSQHSLHSPDALFQELLQTLQQQSPIFAELLLYPQPVSLDALEAFYQWKSTSPEPWDADARAIHLQQLRNLQEQYEGLEDRVRYQEVILQLQEAFAQQPPSTELLQEIRSSLDILRDDFADHPEYRTLSSLWYYLRGQRFEAKAEAVIANARQPYHGPAWLLYGLSLAEGEPNPKIIERGLRYYPFVQHAPHPHLAYTVLRPELRPWLPAEPEAFPATTTEAVLLPTEESEPDTPRYQELLQQGLMAFEQEDWETASFALESAQRLQPEAVEPSLYQARIALAQDQDSTAREQLIALRERFPENEEVALYLGFSYEKERNFTVAESLYRQALQLNPESPKSALRLGTVLIKRGRYEEARSFLESVTAKFPGYAVAWWNLGLLYREVGELELARTTLNTARQLDPNNLQIQAVLRSLPTDSSKE